MSDTRSREHVSEKAIDARGKEILEKIFKSRDLLLDQQVLSQLKKALPEAKIVDAVFDYYKMRLEKIKAKVNKFKQALLRKYALANLSTRQLIEKAKKYTRKYDLSAGEFQMFINLLLNEPSEQPNQYNIPSTPMSRTLGYNIDAAMGDKLVLTEEDIPHFKNIMEIDRVTKQLHTQLTLQTLMYEDCDLLALDGKFDPSKHNAFKHVHPIIAALFLPKVSYLDEHMLLASIANIIKSKKDGKPISTLYEYELYWDLITDPNQSCVSDDRKTMEDLERRVELQSRLWDSVMNLRLGKYYDDDSAAFLAAVEKCKNSIFDAPDLVYAHDEGTIFRRILNVFSIRPTVVSIASINPNPVVLTTLSLSPATYSQITTVPMVNLRLPRPIVGSQNLVSSIKLAESLNQQQWFIDGKTLVPKTQSIIYSRDVMFFHVDRRYKSFNYTFVHRPHVFTGLPPSLSGLDTINDMPVEFEYGLDIGHESFDLRSVVFVEITSVKSGAETSRIITGCSAGIVQLPNAERGIITPSFLQYDPQGAAFQHRVEGEYVSYSPVAVLKQQPRSDVPERAFHTLAQRRGTIFMYVKRH
jgi:hypothetical protein